MQLKLRDGPYIMYVVSFIFGCCLFCFHDKFLVYYRYGAQFVFFFTSFLLSLFRLCALLSILLLLLLLELRVCLRVSTGVIKEDVSKLTYLQLKQIRKRYIYSSSWLDNTWKTNTNMTLRMHVVSVSIFIFVHLSVQPFSFVWFLIFYFQKKKQNIIMNKMTFVNTFYACSFDHWCWICCVHVCDSQRKRKVQEDIFKI